MNASHDDCVPRDALRQANRRNDAMYEVLRGIARQKIGDEIDDPEHADWQAGYEECVKRARAVLKVQV